MRFAAIAARLAVDDAGIDSGQLDPFAGGVVLGTGGVGLHDGDYLDTLLRIATEAKSSRSGNNLLEFALKEMNPLTPIKMLPNIAAAQIAIEHGLRGENHTICTACTSGTQAIGTALRLLRDGQADYMLTGGTDAMINPMGLIGFGMLGVLSQRSDAPERAARPFDVDRDGFVIGEGSAVLVLETMDHARKRGARVLAELLGFGCGSDAFRVTDEREDGTGGSDAMRRAVRDAGISTTDIQYVNAHGTGTRMNDRTEVRSIRSVFGDHAASLAISSTKSQIGHLIAAAGAVEFAACVLALKNQTMLPTINLENQDPECDLDVVPSVAREARLDYVLSNSFGFGGQNACLVAGRGGD